MHHKNRGAPALKRAVRTMAMAMACGLASSMAMAQSSPAETGDAARGQQLFMKNMCFSCHGTQGQGGDRGTGPQLAPNVFPMEAFAMQLRQPRQLMPRFPAKFVSDSDVADIHAYLASVKAGPKAKDIALLNAN